MSDIKKYELASMKENGNNYRFYFTEHIQFPKWKCAKLSVFYYLT